jgi:glycine cleavage system aminomethyltransferase T
MELYRGSPAFDLHKQAGARFATKNYWSRVDYFASNASAGDADRRPGGVSPADWSPAIEAEHRGTRERLGLFDLSSFGKIEVSGVGAADLLEHLCSNMVSRGPGRLTYTQMLNESGGVVADITVGQTSERTFLVVTGTGSLLHDLEWIRSHASQREGIEVRDVTSSAACYGIWGPLAREVLQPLVDISLETIDFPYMTTRGAHVANVPIRLSRVTFVGELGWEIYVPSEYGRAVWEALTLEVGKVDGVRCGYRAIDSLRAEKGYLYLGSDLQDTRTPVSSGLGSFIKLEKDFLGRDAVVVDSTPAERLRSLALVEGLYAARGGNTVALSDGRRSVLTSASVGYTIGQGIAFAYLPADIHPGHQLEVLSDDGPKQAVIIGPAPYDPKGQRIRS